MRRPPKDGFVLLFEAEESSSILAQTLRFDASRSGEQDSGAAIVDTRGHREGAEGYGVLEAATISGYRVS